MKPKLLPVNSDERFKVNGIRRRFDYTEVDHPKSGNCRDIKSVILEEMFPLRVQP